MSMREYCIMINMRAFLLRLHASSTVASFGFATTWRLKNAYIFLGYIFTNSFGGFLGISLLNARVSVDTNKHANQGIYTTDDYIEPVAQIPKYAGPTFHNAPIYNRNVYMLAYFCCQMCIVWHLYIAVFVKYRSTLLIHFNVTYLLP